MLASAHNLFEQPPRSALPKVKAERHVPEEDHDEHIEDLQKHSEQHAAHSHKQP